MLKFGSKSDVTVVHRATIRLFDDNEIIYCDFQVRALLRSTPLRSAPLRSAPSRVAPRISARARLLSLPLVWVFFLSLSLSHSHRALSFTSIGIRRKKFEVRCLLFTPIFYLSSAKLIRKLTEQDRCEKILMIVATCATSRFAITKILALFVNNSMPIVLIFTDSFVITYFSINL